MSECIAERSESIMSLNIEAITGWSPAGKAAIVSWNSRVSLMVMPCEGTVAAWSVFCLDFTGLLDREVGDDCGSWPPSLFCVPEGSPLSLEPGDGKRWGCEERGGPAPSLLRGLVFGVKKFNILPGFPQSFRLWDMSGRCSQVSGV